MRTRLVSILSILMAVGPSRGWTQDAQNTTRNSQPDVKLSIVALEGDGAFNDIRRKIGRNPVIEIRDDDGQPLGGVSVTFTLPDTGPSGTFSGGGKTFLTRTDVQGRAATIGFKPNAIEGRYNIRVGATSPGRSGSLLISQSNTLAGGALVTHSGMSAGKKALIVILIAGGAAGGAIAATHKSGGSGSTAQTPTTTLSSGGVSVGGPR